MEIKVQLDNLPQGKYLLKLMNRQGDAFLAHILKL